MSQFDMTKIFPQPVTTSVQDRLVNFENRRLPEPGSQPVGDLAHGLQLQFIGGNQDSDGINLESVVSPYSALGARGKSTNSLSFPESNVPSGPLDTGRYNRFNEKEHKERE